MTDLIEDRILRYKKGLVLNLIFSLNFLFRKILGSIYQLKIFLGSLAQFRSFDNVYHIFIYFMYACVYETKSRSDIFSMSIVLKKGHVFQFTINQLLIHQIIDIKVYKYLLATMTLQYMIVNKAHLTVFHFPLILTRIHIYVNIKGA